MFDDKPFMVIVRGESMSLSAGQRKKINESTNPTWPHVHAKLEGSFEEFLSVFPCNHVMGMAGDCVQALTYWCEIAGIPAIVLGPDGQKRIAPIWERLK